MNKTFSLEQSAKRVGFLSIFVNSSLHWLDLGFLYAFFVQWSILGLSNAFYLWHHKSACGKLMISFKGLHIFYLLCQKWSFFVREKTHRCVVLSWLITLDRTYKLSSLDYISAHSQNHYSPVQSPWRSTTEIVDLLHMCVFNEVCCLPSSFAYRWIKEGMY